MPRWMTVRRSGERGASAVEYGLLVAAISAVIVTVIFVLGQMVVNSFKDTCDRIGATIPNQPNSCSSPSPNPTNT